MIEEQIKRSTKLVGTWRLIDGQYTLSNGLSDPAMRVKSAIRIYNEENFAAYYELEDGSSLTCITEYELIGDEITIHILYHSEPGEVGLFFKGKSIVEGNRMIHHVTFEDRYQVYEVYERINKNRII